MKANIKPALYLQLIALSIALSYFYFPDAQPVFIFIATLKADYGLIFAIFSTSLFGGFFPFLIMYLTKQILFKPFLQLLFYCCLWAFMGAVVDQFYTLQSVLFGDNNEVSTIIKKVLFDQFVFTVFFASPFLTVLFLFRDSGFKWQRFKQIITRKILLEQVPTTVLSTWVVWIPAVSIIYAMPNTLQVPLFNLVLCMFVLILALVNTEHNARLCVTNEKDRI